MEKLVNANGSSKKRRQLEALFICDVAMVTVNAAHVRYFNVQQKIGTRRKLASFTHSRESFWGGRLCV
jgi:uncharacterized membrane protein YidH (DUF202 family)